MTLHQFVPEGGQFPRGYGIAWRSFDRNGAVCYPIPLNWIMAWLRGTWIWLQIPNAQRYGSWHYSAYALGIDVGRQMPNNAAYQSGYKAAINAVTQNLNSEVERGREEGFERGIIAGRVQAFEQMEKAIRQPPTLAQADKIRMQEAREREQRTQ